MKDKFLVNIGWKKPEDGQYVEGLQFRTWKSWAVLGLALAFVGGVRQFWP